MPLIPTEPLLKGDDATIKKLAQKKAEKEYGSLGTITSKLDAEAKKKFPLYKIGDRITLDYSANSRVYSVTGMLTRIAQKSVTVDEKRVNLIDLPETERAKFDASTNKIIRERYIDKQTQIEKQKLAEAEQKAAAQLKKDYAQQNEKAGYIYDSKKKKWFTAQDIANQFMEPLLNIQKLLNEAEAGDANAQFELAECFYNGKNIKKSLEEAFVWYEKAANQGNVEALKRLGDCYRLGEGVKEDLAEAGILYIVAATGGNVEAQFLVGCSAMMNEDYSTGVEYLCKAAEQGHVEAQNLLGFYYQREKKDYSESAKWFRKAAEQGNADAQVQLGAQYSAGMGVKKDDIESVKWFRMAAEQGNADGQLGMASCYMIKNDWSEAEKWFRKAAEQGNAEAQNGLGLCYQNKKEWSEAVKWWRKAAEQGQELAQRQLGLAYLLGRGVRKNETEGLKWLRKAAEQGDEGAQKALKELGY